MSSQTKVVLPTLSHLQFGVVSLLSVLQAINSEPVNGQVLRTALLKRGIRLSVFSFYQLMGRLEKTKFVSGIYRKTVVNNWVRRQREYKVTAKGVTAVAASREFYRMS